MTGLQDWHSPIVLLGFGGLVPKKMFEKICLLVTIRRPHDTNVWEEISVMWFLFLFFFLKIGSRKYVSIPVQIFSPIFVWHPCRENAADWAKSSEITLSPVDHRGSVQTCRNCWDQNFIANSYNFIETLSYDHCGDHLLQTCENTESFLI